MLQAAAQPSHIAILTRVARLAFAVGVVAVIVLSLAPSSTLPSLDLWDKIEHAVAYAFLAATGCFGFGLTAPRAHLPVVMALAAMGGLIELAQPAAGRMTSAADLLANVIGIALGWLLARSFALVLRRPLPA